MESYSKFKYISGIIGILLAAFFIGYFIYTYNIVF